MMMISPAAPEPVCPAVPAPAHSTVTIACTSVPPSGRNSFWYTDAVKSAIGLPSVRSSILAYVGPVGRGRRASACHETNVRLHGS